MHHYRRNLGDYAKKTGRLTMLQHGAYNLLLDACYDRERFPTKEEAVDWAWASSEEEIKAVEFVLRRFFTLQDDGTYMQKRVAEEVCLYLEHCTKQKENGRKGGRPKKPKPLEKKPTGFSEEPGGKPEVRDGFVEKPKKSLTNNQLTNNQLTNNQEPLKNTCAEPEGSPPAADLPAVLELPVIALPTNKHATKGEEFIVTAPMAAEFGQIYPSVNVQQELRNMLGWLNANRTKRKTHGGMPKFINGWLAREQNRGGTSADDRPNGNSGADRRSKAAQLRDEAMFGTF